MKAQHTPGPWTAIVKLNNGHWRVVKRWYGKPEPVAAIRSSSTVGRESANAALIAAAPDLLAALQMFLEQYGSDGTDPDRESRPEIKAARAAIRKARGE